jgi:hypothetical protein
MAELLDARVERFLKRGLVTHVRLPEKHFLAGLFDKASGLFEVFVGAQLVGHNVEVFTDVDSDDVCALLGTRHGVRPALAAGSPRDEHDAPVE